MTEQLQSQARQIRTDILKMLYACQSGHPGGSLSLVEILLALYNNVLRYDPQNPSWPERDRLVLSKGHAGAGMYAVLAESGFFPVSELEQHCQNGSRLSGHVSHKGVPGVEVSTGSLGQGMPMAMGMAMAAKMNGSDHRVFCIIGDGECDEGAIWESALIANQFALDNFIVTINFNKIQSITSVENTIRLEPLDPHGNVFF